MKGSYKSYERSCIYNFLKIVANLEIKFKIMKYIATFLKNCKYSKICQILSMIKSITHRLCCKNWSITDRSYESS